MQVRKHMLTGLYSISTDVILESIKYVKPDFTNGL